ncbi:hypothetical protein [Rhizobium grahamii]|uniref:Uncharacterized protein n=1 Tax=Rhizobium grahamii TaxID=1120045 RepID=A0A370KHW3_9HYPH|nr:hypothetical protein [Rhizobium grahamii]RDJ05273.1 hypothetical protein B5K06_26015 [Rhizobium grahamii]
MFLELHDNSGPIHVNIDNVISFRRFDRQETTHVVMVAGARDTLATFFVTETPSQIAGMITEEQSRLASLSKSATPTKA